MNRNIVLIVLDTVRKDYFDEYANRIQSLSDASYTQCRAASSTSVPSHASMVTGKLPHQHGIHSYNPYFTDLKKSDTFLSNFENYTTVGISANAFAGSAFDFDTLFDEFIDISWTRRFPKGIDVKEFAMTNDENGAKFLLDFFSAAIKHKHPILSLSNGLMARLDLFSSRLPLPRLVDDGANTILKSGLNWMDQNQSPFFMFFNLMDAHTPHRNTLGYNDSLHDVNNTWNSMDNFNQWEISLNGIEGYEDDVRNFRQLYGTSIEYLDRKVANFIKKLDNNNNNNGDNITFIITSDHGENLGFPEDEGMFGHKSSLTESLLHVPLEVINPPPGFDKNIHDYISHLNLGKLLTALSEGESVDITSKRIPAERIGTVDTPDLEDSTNEARLTRMIRCAYENETKFVWDSLGTCQEIKLDHSKPCWQSIPGAYIDSPPKWTKEFFECNILEYKSQFGSLPDLEESLDQATRSRLEELGYL